MVLWAFACGDDPQPEPTRVAKAVVTTTPMPVAPSATQTVTAAQTATPEPTPKPDDLAAPRTQSPFMTNVGREALKTDHVKFYLAPDSVSESKLLGYSRHIEVEVTEIAEKLGIDPSSAFPEGLTMTFISPRSEGVDKAGPGLCPVRGSARPAGLAPEVKALHPVWVVADDETMADQVIAVAAHEVAHHVGWARFDYMGDRLLVEGLATWLAQDSWLRWHGWDSLDEAVRGFLSAGTYVPLAQRDEHPGRASDAECLARRDTLYTEYASFVGFLIDRYGVERFEELADTIPVPDDYTVFTITFGPGIPTPMHRLVPTPAHAYKPPMADYRAVYGRSFEELENEWPMVDYGAVYGQSFEELENEWLRLLILRATGLGK